MKQVLRMISNKAKAKRKGNLIIEMRPAPLPKFPNYWMLIPVQAEQKQEPRKSRGH